MNATDLQELPIRAHAVDLESLDTEELLAWGFDTFSPKIALACSFQAEGSVPDRSCSSPAGQ